MLKHPYMTPPQTDQMEATRRFESAISMRRQRTPDASASDCEECLELLGRLARLLIERKERSSRGDDNAARDLIVARDEIYNLCAEMETPQ